MGFRRRKRQEEGINMTPLLDVMFILLIFIVVSAQYTNIQAMKVRFPKAETGKSVEKIDKVIIGVTKQEEILLDGRLVDARALEAALDPLGKKIPPPAVFIQADEGATTGKLVTVMDVASKAGLSQISIQTKK
ncbi:biopolymer transporter ExbD [Deltaproteobacteria bacterium PRO3]|nr:biopolymer transporter ExbD [Deltaproteobacteria bacterium PRO3]